MTRNRILALTLLTLGSAAARPTFATDLWLHKVHDRAEDSKVTVNLPLSVVQAATPLLPAESRTSGQLRIDDQDLSVADLRRIWNQVRGLDDATFVTVDGRDGKLRVAKSGRFLLLHAAHAADTADKGRRSLRSDLREVPPGHNRPGGQVEVRMPLSVVSALLSGEGDRFNVVAALEALAQEGQGELMTVDGDHETVRMWVDRRPESR
ncbi:MAG TPA: hypothetical protein VHR45_14985 [Thermoanaerobaculia bacterium]|nr:hypothetical protein [Thermoanaerobaculia bacterium]